MWYTITQVLLGFNHISQCFSCFTTLYAILYGTSLQMNPLVVRRGGKEIEFGAKTAFRKVDAHDFLAATVHFSHIFCWERYVSHMTFRAPSQPPDSQVESQRRRSSEHVAPSCRAWLGQWSSASLQHGHHPSCNWPSTLTAATGNEIELDSVKSDWIKFNRLNQIW